VSFRSWQLTSVLDVQLHILHYGGVVTGMILWPDFAAFFQRSPKGVYTDPPAGTYPLESAYGHAVFCTGWNDVEGWWLCKNSWGPGFADGGFFRVSGAMAGGLGFCG
jgi:Papain family cysteine protease